MRILYPKKYYEHTYHFTMEVPPPPGKTDQSQIDFVLYKRHFDDPPLAKRHIQIPVKQQIKHDNIDLVFGHRMVTGPTP